MPNPPGYLECLAWDAATPWPWPGWGLAFAASVLAFTRGYREFAVPCLVSGWCGLVAACLVGACLPCGVILLLSTPYATLQGLLR